MRSECRKCMSALDVFKNEYNKAISRAESAEKECEALKKRLKLAEYIVRKSDNDLDGILIEIMRCENK